MHSQYLECIFKVCIIVGSSLPPHNKSNAAASTHTPFTKHFPELNARFSSFLLRYNSMQWEFDDDDGGSVPLLFSLRLLYSPSGLGYFLARIYVMPEKVFHIKSAKTAGGLAK